MVKILSNNKQACEQLNSWLGGFESILKRMVPGNFDWFLHTMLFYHTRYVLKKQNMRRENEDNDDDDGGDEFEMNSEVDVVNQQLLYLENSDINIGQFECEYSLENMINFCH